MKSTFLSTIDIYNGKLQDIGPFGTGMTTLGCTTEGQLYGLSRAGELRKIDRQDTLLLSSWETFRKPKILKSGFVGLPPEHGI